MILNKIKDYLPLVRVERLVRWFFAWLFVRPRRWFFWQMIANGSFVIRWKPEYDECLNRWRMPNIHWWILYKTVFGFFKWLYCDAWRIFCTWENGWLKEKPWIARAIHRIGSTTAGFAISGGECFHCASPEGDQVYLFDDETGTLFRLEETWTECSEDGTDYRFRGTTICPKCGHEASYEDGSL